MGDSGRRRSSMWDVEEENRPFTSRGHYREYSSSGADNSTRHKDHSGWTSWEDNDDGIMKDIAETRERIEKNSYYKNMSPGLDGLGRQSWSRSPDNRWSQSRRYTGRGRSRSRSRSRGRSRGREKIRSRSRSWSRGRNKGRGRSKSRSRSRGSARGQTRSRSPFHDQGRESYGWSDRRSGSGRLSQTCRDFAVGMCRRGSQCRFLHEDNVDHRDASCLETGVAGRWRSKPEPGRGSRYPRDKPRDKFSDAYDEEDEPPRIRSRDKFSCVDFMKGNCRFGAACRFSHHSASQSENYDRGFRNKLDPEHERHKKKAGKTLCKFYLAGKCQRDNCRFAHDGPTSNDLDGRLHDSNGGQGVGDLNKWWNGPTWDDTGSTARLSNVRTGAGWGEGGEANMDLSEEFSIDRRSDGRWGHNLENESRVLSSTEVDAKGFNRRKYDAFHRGNGYSGTDMDVAKPIVIENSFGEGDRLASQNFQSQNADRFSPRQIQSLNGEASSSYLSTTPPKASISPDIHQYQGLAELNSVKVFASGSLYEVKDSANTSGQSINPDNRSAFSEHSSVLNGTDQGLQVMSPLSSAHNVDLNRPLQRIGSPLSLHDEKQSYQQELTTAELQVSTSANSFPAAVPGEGLAPMTTPPPHLTQNLLDGLRPEFHTVLDLNNSVPMAPPNAANPVVTNHTLNMTETAQCLEQYNHVNNGMEPARSSNNDPPGNSSYSNGQEHQKPMELVPSLSIINSESGKIQQSGNLDVEFHDSSKLNQRERTEKSEANGNGIMVVVDSQPVAKNICSENLDGQGKDEGGNSNKDDKGIRLFKNALIEFVKEILKPTWKEGRMSREVHKTIVKKVVDKVTSSIQGEHVPKTQDRIEQYLSSSKPKITKLVQAYVDRSHKTEA